MQGITLLTLLALSAGFTVASEVEMKGDKTITKVVKLLQGMLAASKKDADKEHEMFAKYKCYCDTNEAERRESMATGENSIAMSQAKIEELQGSTGELSSRVAELTASLAENKDSQKAAKSMHDKAKKAFKRQEADLKKALGQMKSAMDTLGAVGADQTDRGNNADNKQFMAGFKGFLQGKDQTAFIQSEMQSALSNVEAYMNEDQYNKYISLKTAFLQGPFTGTYSSQSGEVMGMIKQMSDTFAENLATATRDEDSRWKSYEERKANLESQAKEQTELKDAAEDKIGENDKTLASTRGKLKAAKATYKEDDEFLNGFTKGGKTDLGLVQTCANKADDYDNRKQMRSNEDAAVSQAISILNSDAAFATFNTVDATSTGKTSFLQISRHMPSDDVRAVMQRLLRRAAAEAGLRQAPRIKHVVSVLQADNPFDTVLAEVTKMIAVIQEEGKSDSEKLSWCNSERKENNADLKASNKKINRLTSSVDKNEDNIGEPKTGFTDMIAATEAKLRQNNKDQVTGTKDRAEDNTVYQQNVKNLVATEKLLENALKVLSNYYDQIQNSFLQSNDENGKPPKSWENDSYTGQKGSGGNKAITMLQFILKETNKEEAAAHKAEEKAQHDFEDEMTKLKKDQAKKEGRLADLQEKLADEESALSTNNGRLKAEKKDKAAIENYLVSIKPGCDFITSNFKQRNKNRATETAALESARKALKASPAYQNFKAEATAESYGTCKDPCLKDKAHVNCKACMADTTVMGYCTGHKGTKGC